MRTIRFLRKPENGLDGRERGPNGNGEVLVRDRGPSAGKLVAIAHFSGRKLFRPRRQLAERYLHHK